MALKLRPGVFDTETEYGIVLLDGDSGEYYDLNATGTLVLRTLLAGATAGEAAQALTEDYAVGLDDASRDVRELLEHVFLHRAQAPASDLERRREHAMLP